MAQFNHIFINDQIKLTMDKLDDRIELHHNMLKKIKLVFRTEIMHESFSL